MGTHQQTEPIENQPLRIVLVDDEPPFRAVLEEILTAFGYKVHAFGCVEEALGHLEDQTPDLILTDLMMPEIDGYQFIHMLKENPVWAGVPVVVVSALAGTEDRENCMRLGADSYLSKPFTAMELRQMITEILPR